MAKQKGIIPLKGTIGNITFYKSADGYLAREKGGVDKQRIATDPAFQRTRENGAEFGRAGIAGKILRTALRTLLQETSDAKMVGRLTREMVKVIQADAVNPRGMRNVIDGEAELLEGFEFNINSKLDTTLYAPFTATINRVTGELAVSLPAFVPANMIAAPAGGTHFKIISAGAEIDFENEVYVAQAIKENGTAQRITIRKFEKSIYEEDAFKAALTADAIFSCVDRPHPRQIMNFIAYSHMIPVIDGGIRARTNRTNTKLVGADWKIQTVGHDRPCLECLEQFTATFANLDKEGLLDDPAYMEGADESIKRLVTNENVFAFSMNVASFEILQLLSMIVLPEYQSKVQQQFYHFTTHEFESDPIHECKQNCFYKAIVATGDNAGVIMYRHQAPALLA